MRALCSKSIFHVFLFKILLVWQKRTSPPHVQNSIVALGFETKIKHHLSFIGYSFTINVIHWDDPYPHPVFSSYSIRSIH